MKRFTALVCLSLVVLQVGTASSAVSSRDWSGYHVADGRYAHVYTGQPIGAKVDPDTVYMMGGPGLTTGKFQSGVGGVLPDRQGWIGADLTSRYTARWQVTPFNGREILDVNSNPNHTMWCGEIFPLCNPQDPQQGYGNNYDEWLDWYGTVANNAVSTNVTITANVNNDTEPNYDFLHFKVSRAVGWETLDSWTGVETYPAHPLNKFFSVGVADYVGSGFNQIHMRFEATSDREWSDADCRWPSYGHSNLDDIQVTTNNGVMTFDNFEDVTSNWNVALPPGVGDFSHVWPSLTELDPCNSDDTPLFAFIDDGNVVPGTGGTPGITWTYGPGGYVFNPNGGLAGPGYHVRNEIWSPVLEWPSAFSKQYSGFEFDFNVYEHLPLTNGIYWLFHVRSSTNGGASWGSWRSTQFVYYSHASNFLDCHVDATTGLLRDRSNIQIALAVWDYGWIWGYHTPDVTPAPYFDNVRALAYVFQGPALGVDDIDVFQDNFPAIATIDYANLGNNSVRLDIAKNISPQMHMRNDPGDSMVATVAVVRSGATLQGVPRLYYKLKPNHLFDAWRTSGLPNSGFVNGDTTKTQGSVIPNSWRWDLPDSNFFFPGDVLHWYLEAQDNLGGNIGTTRLPADTSGFSLFPGRSGYVPLRYPSMCIVRALPTLNSATPGDQPRLLFWNDFADRGGEDEWSGALAHLGYREGTGYDEYYTNGPDSGVGNGLGGRATGPQLAGYNIMLYTSGDLSNYTLSSGDFKHDPGNDIAVMTAWLSLGSKKWFCTGDDLAYDLGQLGAVGLTFRNTFLPMIFNATDVRPLIQNQINPVVNPVAGNPVGLTQSYIAYGGCPIFHKFDAVQAAAGSVRIATFQQLGGAAYPYAAALYVPNAGDYGDQVVYMPYDFMSIYKIPNTAKARATLEKRAQVLQQILTFFGVTGTSPATGVDDTPGLAFSAKNYPNPFNPSTKIDYSLPRDGQLSIKIYNVRGELVRTLLDSPSKAGTGSVTWLGDNDRGQKVASGVYFYQVKSADNEIFNKMTIVK